MRMTPSLIACAAALALVSGAQAATWTKLKNAAPGSGTVTMYQLTDGTIMVKDGDLFGDGVNVAARLETALRRWCAARTERVERESRGQWRQGLWALRGGLVLFVVGLALSTDFLDPEVPQYLQDLLGNGVFSVIAWIGLWYPLDLLFFARSPAKREMRALDALATMPVEVRARP